MTKSVAIIGGGPSGLMAAEILSANNFNVTIYERKPTFGRKFLMAGRGGLNITHSENFDNFIKKYRKSSKNLEPIIHKFTPNNLRDWCDDLGEKTFIGSSGRVFPDSFKASPLLRSWLKRLEKQGVNFKLKHDWLGWNENSLIFNTTDVEINVKHDITILALGGASWPDLGSDGSWVNILKKDNIDIATLCPSNCGFTVNWTSFFAEKFQGQSLKTVELCFADQKVKGEFIITENGVEGGAIYALSSYLRDDIYKNGSTTLKIDLKPDLSVEEIEQRLQKPKSKLSMSNYLRKTLNLSNVAIGLLMEVLDRSNLNAYSPKKLTDQIKNYSITLTDTFPIDRAISTAGGVKFDQINEGFMLLSKQGVYVTGEMLNWEAPTGGYLLQACLATGAHVAHSIIKSEEK